MVLENRCQKAMWRLRNTPLNNLWIEKKYCCISKQWEIQLTLEQHRFELDGSSYTQIFFSTNTLEKNLETCNSLKKLTGELCSLEIFFKNQKKLDMS